MTKNYSRKVIIELSPEQNEAFDRLKNILVSEDVMLSYPNYKKPLTSQQTRLATDWERYCLKTAPR